MSKNTEKEWEIPTTAGSHSSPTKLEKSAAQLEQELQHERDARNEERFYWILALTVVTNVLMVNMLPSLWLYPLLFLVQLAGLIGLADSLGVDRVRILLEWLYARYIRTAAPRP